jgi:hypothetical protein
VVLSFWHLKGASRFGVASENIIHNSPDIHVVLLRLTVRVEVRG